MIGQPQMQPELEGWGRERGRLAGGQAGGH
jgi:hypothetical protein